MGEAPAAAATKATKVAEMIVLVEQGWNYAPCEGVNPALDIHWLRVLGAAFSTWGPLLIMHSNAPG